MGRAVIHTEQALLDAAISLFATGGSRAVTMTAVARAVGAPSGSVYHRFPDRGSLLAAVWLRTSRAFEAEFATVIGESPTPAAAVGAAVWVVETCQRQPERAAVLNAGPQAFNPETWPRAAVDELEVQQARRDAAMATLINEVATAADVPRDEAAFAMFGLPLAIVGQHLRVPEPVPASASDLVRRLASRLLGQVADRQPRSRSRVGMSSDPS
ncbi:MAG TPA: TetR/AcrR family transcriptional regulator [Marmoricola sp.]|jgi:AcrR family transcriptional regulator|nr:TetR/AcrR family transcriptional regulator [Marmoricola sp.]